MTRKTKIRNRYIRSVLWQLLLLSLVLGLFPVVPAEADGSFEILFLDVGQADSALVLCDGHSMLIDGGNKGDSNLIYTTLKKQNIKALDYIICTHPHEDHVGGLSGALNYAKAKNAFCPLKKYDSKGFENFVKYLDQQGTSLTVPEPGEVFSLGSASATVLGPIRSATGNNNSIVLRIVYGETSFLFMGDAEYEEEQDILDAGYDLKSNVIKVGHHGSGSATSYRLLYEVMPEYAVISVGASNSYGHPEENTLSRLRDADVTVYRTDQNGNIICKSDGKTVTFTSEKDFGKESGANLEPEKTFGTEKQIGVETGVETRGLNQEKTLVKEESVGSASEVTYILNTNTKKFHRPNCSSVKQMKDENKQDYIGSRKKLLADGYDPCKKCNP